MMKLVVEILFWCSLFVLLYTYIGYPLLLMMLIKIKTMIGRKETEIPPAGSFTPPVTLIVAAFNEETVIEEKIRNSLELDYPPGSLELIFITDGSSDATTSIIKRYPGIRLLHLPERQGKLAAMSRAADLSSHPYLFFSDANTFLNRNCIQMMVRHYFIPKMGAVAGEKKIITRLDSGAVPEGEGLYWRYESLLKKLDSDLYTVVGAAGELFSIRKSLYKKLPEHTVIEDFVQSLFVCEQGYRVKYEPGAFSLESASVSFEDEMERKTRISAGAFQAMGMVKKLFNVFRYPVVAFQLISHRILRWTLCPLLLPVLLISSIILYTDSRSFFQAFMTGAQLAFYACAFAGWWLARRNKKSRLLYFPFYFLFMNYCVYAGFSRFLQGRQSVLWDKAERKAKTV